MQFQTTYGAPAPLPPPPIRIDPNAPLYASEDAVVASLSSNECIFQVKRTGEAHVMTFQVLQALDQCHEFRTLDEHVARIMTGVQGLGQQRDAVMRVLGSLIQRGLLVSDSSYLQRLTEVPAREKAALRGVFIRACDRPAQLSRLLDSLADYERRFRAGRPYVVLDDSRDKTALDRHRDLVREFARQTGCKLTYVGPAERARLVERIGKALPNQRDVAARLMLPGNDNRFGGGRNWNLATLLGAGGRMILLDDDQRLSLRRENGVKPGFDPVLSGEQITHFYATADQARGAGEEILEDPFDAHLAHCGASLGEILSGGAFPLSRESLRGINVNRLAHLQPEAQILATLGGTFGSARSESAVWLYHLDSTARAEFCATREDYLRNVEAQHLWNSTRQARAITVAAYSPFAMDNQALLPWTNPVGRGEDRLFSTLAHFCNPNALVLELPLAIAHEQAAARKRSGYTRTAMTPRVNHFVADFVQRQFGLSVAEDVDQRLGYFGSMLRDLAGASAKARVAHLHEYLSYVRSVTVDGLQQQFEAATDAPVYWQADVRAIIEANGRALIAKNPPRLGDWPENLDEAGCAQALREEAETMASYSDAWPRLWNYARDQGERLLGAV